MRWCSPGCRSAFRARRVPRTNGLKFCGKGKRGSTRRSSALVDACLAHRQERPEAHRRPSGCLATRPTRQLRGSGPCASSLTNAVVWLTHPYAAGVALGPWKRSSRSRPADARCWAMLTARAIGPRRSARVSVLMHGLRTSRWPSAVACRRSSVVFHVSPGRPVLGGLGKD